MYGAINQLPKNGVREDRPTFSPSVGLNTDTDEEPNYSRGPTNSPATKGRCNGIETVQPSLQAMHIHV